MFRLEGLESLFMPPINTAFHQRYLYLLVFASGMTVLAVELSASRLLGNVFGTSNLVWANIIGLMLIYLTVGYYLGGRWADRSPHFATLYRILCWGAFLSGLAPLVARPVLFAAARAVYDLAAGVALGSFLSVLVLFALPVTLLGCVSPFALRLALADPARAGQTAGSLYALSTLGSILGTFAPVLYLLPELGTTYTFLLFAFGLWALAWYGLYRLEGAKTGRWLWMPLVLLVLTLLITRTPARPIPAGYRLLFERDSAYNYIQIVEDGAGYRYLWLNEGQGIHSQWHPTQRYYGRTWDYFLAAPYFNAGYTPQAMRKIAIVGLAGGTIALQHAAVYGEDLPIDGIEIDGEIVRASRRYLGLNLPALNVITEDARYALRQLEGGYSLVAIDAYRVPYVPWQLTTVEFFREVEAQLGPDGVVAINVGRTPSDRRLEQVMAYTMGQVFPSVYRLEVPNSLNTILVATRQPSQAENLLANWRALDAQAYPLLYQVLYDAANALRPTETLPLLLTDDRAPIETLVNAMTLRLLFSPDLNQLE
jgi:spermidine synthase